MAKKLIGFEKISGVFEEAMKPYQKITEKADMSLPLEVDGHYYRILRTTLNGIGITKIFVCREDGTVVRDKELTSKCIRFYFYLSSYGTSKQQIKFDLKHGNENQHIPLINAFQTMVDDLNPILSTTDNEVMEHHLYALKEIYRLSVELADLANEILDLKKVLKDSKTTYLTSALMEKISGKEKKRNLFRDCLDGVLIEDGERARDRVKKILKTRKYKKEISNRGDIHRVIENINEVTKVSKQYIKNFKELHELRVAEGLSSSLFSIERQITNLKSGVYHKQVMEFNVTISIKKGWILSPDCLFK